VPSIFKVAGLECLKMKRIMLLLLAGGLPATTGCISAHLVKDKAQPHVDYSVEAQEIREVKGEPGYYALLPLTIAGDIATSPLQLLHFVFTRDSHWGNANIYGVPVPLP
jgi:hypothetical protein